MKIKIIFIAVCSIILSGFITGFTGLFAQDPLPKVTKLNLKDVLALTMQNDQRIEAARFSLKMAREDVKDARSYYRPKLSGVGSISYSEVPVVNFFGNTSRDGLNYYGGIQLSKELLSFGRYSSQLRQTKAGVKQSTQELRVTESDVMLETIESYLDYSRTLRAKAIFQAYANDMEELLKRTKDKFDNQLIGKSEYLLVRSRLQQARANISNNESAITRAYERLSTLINRDRYSIIGDPINFYEALLPATLEQAVISALDADPRIKATKALVEAKSEAANYAKASLHPKVTLQAGYTRGEIEGQKTGEAIVGMNVELPLYDGGTGWASMRRARSDASRARAMLTEETYNSEERVTAAWKIYNSIKRNEQSWLDALDAEKEAVAEIQKEVDNEIRSLVVLLETREQLMEAEINANGATYSRMLAGYELLVASGKLSALMRPAALQGAPLID